VFVIWEPVLLTDWRRPGGSQTALVPDPRAIHFWDIDRKLSALYGGPANLDSLAPVRDVGFQMEDVVWDAALVYPPGAKWGDAAKILLAPVAKYRDQLAEALR